MRRTTTVAACLLLASIATACSSSDEPTAAPSTPADPTVTAAAEEEPTPEDTTPEVLGLTDGVSYEDGVEVALSGYKRGTSSEWASPENTPYVSFTMKVTNGSDGLVDLGTGYVMCYRGDESVESEQIFDSERGLDGLPALKLRPGRSAKAVVACELPKGESYLQVELAPSVDAEVAVFAGEVK
jgi:hypothetical protein